MNTDDFDILRLASQGYCCTQIILQMALDLQGRENQDLLRAASALCRGFPDGDGTCGALTGAACLIGLYCGKGDPTEEEHPQYPLLLDKLGEWFRGFCGEKFEGITCREIVTDAQPDAEICGGLISACYSQAMALLLEHDIEVAE